MTSISCTICKVQIACKFIDMLKIDCFARKNECIEELLALHANKWLYCRIFYNSRIFLQTINISDSKQPNTVDLFRSFELAYQCIEVLNKRQYHIHSHQHCPLSVLRLSALQSASACFAVQIVQSSLHSFKLVFLVMPGISQ